MAETDKTVIMHMSDLHFGIEKKYPGISEYRKEVFKKFMMSYSNLIADNPGLAPDILVVSGDIAFDGSSDDYEKAKLFFEDFLAIPGNKITRNDIVLCFGNHDVRSNIKSQNGAWFDIDMGCFITRPDPDIDFEAFHKYELDVLKRQHRFENAEKFCREMGFVPLSQNTNSPYKYAYGYRKNLKGIDFISLNTEWDFWGASDKEAKDEILRIGTEIYRSAVAASMNKSLFDLGTLPRFVVYHRPLKYLHKHEQYIPGAKDADRRTGNLLVCRNDVSLNGHMHEHGLEEIGSTHTVITAGTAPAGRKWEFSWNIICVPKKLDEGKTHCEHWLYKYHPLFTFQAWRREIFGTFYIHRYEGTKEVEDCIFEYYQLREQCKQPGNVDLKAMKEALQIKFNSLIEKGLTSVFINFLGTSEFDAMKNDLNKKRIFEPMEGPLKKTHDPGSSSGRGPALQDDKEKVKSLHLDNTAYQPPIDPKNRRQ